MIKNVIAIIVATLLLTAGIAWADFPAQLNNFVAGDVIRSADWNLIEAELGTRSGRVATGTSDSLNFIVRNAQFPTTTLRVGLTASTTISGDTGTSTFVNGISLNAGCFLFGGSCLAGANPTATIGLTATNGSAVTFMRSDAAPALSQSIAPTWTGLHIFNTGGMIVNASSSYAYFNSASSSIDILRVNTRLGVATSTPGQSAAFGVTGDGFFSGNLYATNIYVTSLTGSNCIGETGGLIGAGTNCVVSIQQTYGTAQNGAITLGTSTTAISGDWGITNSSGTFTFNIPSSSAANRGLLTSADFTTLNNKISSTSLSGASVISYTSGTGVITTTGGTFGSGNYTFSAGVSAVTATATTQLVAPIPRTYIIGTSTMGTGTSTPGKLPGEPFAKTYTQIGCNSIGGGTFVAQFGDSTASTSIVSSTGLTTTFTTLSSNNVFTAGETLWFAYGSVSGTVINPSCTVQ